MSLFIKFHKIPDPKVAEFIAEQFYSTFSKEFGFDKFFYQKLHQGFLSFVNRYDPNTCGLWTLESLNGPKGSLIIDGGERE